MAPQTKQRILEASLELFAERGFAGTSVVAIEAAAGLAPGRGGFYRHFKNKEAVLRAAVDARIEGVQAERRRRVDTPRPLDARSWLIGRVLDTISTLEGLSDLILLLFHDGRQFPDIVEQVATALADGGVVLDAVELRGYVDSGELRIEDPEALATIVLNACVGYALGLVFFGRPIAQIDRHRYAQALVGDLVGATEPA